MSYSSEVLADAPRIYFRLGESSTSMPAVDSSGNGLDGQYVNNPTVGVAGLDGSTNTAASFNGTNQWVGRSLNEATPSTFTLEALVKTSGPGANQRHVVGRGGSSVAGDIGVVDLNNGVPRFFAYDTTGAFGLAIGTASIADGARHHLAGVFSNGSLKLYVDGVEVASGSLPGSLVTTTSVPFTVAAGEDLTRYYAGVVDEAAYYTKALSAARVAAHFNALSAMSGSLAGSLPKLSGSFAGSVASPPAAGSLAGSLPALTGSFAGTSTAPPIVSSDEYANYGYNYTGLGLVEFDPPIAPTPAKVRREVTRRVHQSLPAPTLVDGRPV